MKRINPNACREGFRLFPAEKLTQHKMAFTLVELLIVISIIAMLATMSFVVMESAQRTARMGSTRVTVDKIDQAVTELYESYIYRRFDVDTRKLDRFGVSYTAEDIARIRLHYLHDTMRMEMPNNWIEALTPPIAYPGYAGAGLVAPDSALRRTYVRAFLAAGGVFTIENGRAAIDVKEGNNEKILTDEQSKLLYLIVMNSDSEMREMFGESGTADPEGVGLPCFIDAWQKPIYFLRWAPGFYGSERQPDIWKWTGTSPNNLDNVAEWNGKLSPNQLSDDVFTKYYNNKENIDSIFENPGDKLKYVFNTIIEMPDPMDPMKVRRSSTDSTAMRSRPGWLLVPLVYSAGPDKEYAISIPKEIDDMVVLDPFAQGFGAPFEIGGENLDNIHNHTMGGR